MTATTASPRLLLPASSSSSSYCMVRGAAIGRTARATTAPRPSASRWGADDPSRSVGYVILLRQTKEWRECVYSCGGDSVGGRGGRVSEILRQSLLLIYSVYKIFSGSLVPLRLRRCFDLLIAVCVVQCGMLTSSL